MRKLCFLILLCLPLLSVQSQKSFELSRSTKRYNNSLYGELQFIDSRTNPEDMGFVQTTMFNKYTPIAVEKPFSDQFNSLFLSLVDTIAQYRTMLVQLRDIKFREETKATSERGFCNIRISLYEKKDNAYHFINTIDTIIMVKAMDVTGKLLDAVSKTIASQIGKNLTRLPEDYSMPFTMDDLATIDNLEKNSIPIYNTDKLTDGLYSDFRSFANQTPTHTTMQVKREKGDIKEIKIVNPEKPDKWKKIKSKDYYVVITEGNPFLIHKEGYFPIIFENDNYYVRTYMNVPQSNTGIQIGLAVGFGMIGGFFGMLTATENSIPVTAKLDHLNGDFIIQP